MHKTDLFLSVAKELNAIGVTPLLYGSLGLEVLLKTDLRAEDIDILIPEVYLNAQWQTVVSMMDSLGCILYDLHEHAFQKEGVSIAFASIEELVSFADVHVCAKHLRTENGVSFYLLTPEAYLKVYTASAKDGYRKDKKHKNDCEKISLIQSALELKQDVQ